MTARVALALEALVLSTGCAATTRMGAQYRSLDDHPVAEAQFTFGAGLGTGEEDGGVQLVTPVVAFSTGDRLDVSDPQGSLEIGTEVSTTGPRWGFRVSPRVGAGLFGTPGAYLGLRFGPTLALAPIEGDHWTPTLSLEGLAASGLGAEVDNASVFGATLAFGWDLYGTFHIPHGRPLRDARGSSWVARVHTGRTRAPALARASLAQLPLAAEQRAQLGRSWLEEAQAEYASIASFLQLAKELGALGAPWSLVRRAYVAAEDEVRHAEACFGLAASYLGAEMRPEPLPAVHVRPTTTLQSLALECWLDGCLGEGSAARLARARAARSTQPTVRRALQRIARDEATHAELGWDVLTWCARREPRAVRDALDGKPHLPYAAPHAEGLKGLATDLTSHGLFSAADFDGAYRAVHLAACPRLGALLQGVGAHAGIEHRAHV